MCARRGGDQDHVPDEGIETGFVEERDVEKAGPVPAEVVVEHCPRHSEAHGGVDDGVQNFAIALALRARPKYPPAQRRAVEGSGGRFCGSGGIGFRWGRRGRGREEEVGCCGAEVGDDEFVGAGAGEDDFAGEEVGVDEGEGVGWGGEDGGGGGFAGGDAAG